MEIYKQESAMAGPPEEEEDMSFNLDLRVVVKHPHREDIRSINTD